MEILQLDWYNSRIELIFKVNKLADGGNLVKDKGIVNGSHSFIRRLKVEVGGIPIFDTEPINHAVNLKNLLDYSTQFERDMGSNQFIFLILVIRQMRMIILVLLQEELFLN